MQFEAKLSLDGLMTLVAGIIAFVAVIIQIRSSSRQVQDQIKAQRDAEREERERQKRALATALVFEIDHCYRAYLPRALTLARGLRGNTLDPKAGVAIRFEAASFDVYSGNVQSLGTLGAEASGPVIRFYKIACDLKDLMQHYRECLAQGDPFKISDNTLATIKHISSGLKIGALEACSWLCLAAGLPIDSTDAGVLKDKPKIMQLAKSMNVTLTLPSQGG
jgi:hypothetical protein